MKKEHIERIYAWNEWAGNKAGEIDYNLEYRLYNEEFQEFNDAVKIQDKKEIVDGLIDMMIVFIGSCYKKGYTVDKIVDIIKGSDNTPCHDEYLQGLQRGALSVFRGGANINNIITHYLPQVCKDTDWAIEEILESNESKFVDWKAIFKDGKIQKWPNYFKPNLTPYIK